MEASEGMKLRLMVEVEVGPAGVERVREYVAVGRTVMVDPGGDEPSMVGPLIGAVPVEPVEGHLFPSRPRPGIVGT